MIKHSRKSLRITLLLFFSLSNFLRVCACVLQSFILCICLKQLNSKLINNIAYNCVCVCATHVPTIGQWKLKRKVSRERRIWRQRLLGGKRGICSCMQRLTQGGGGGRETKREEYSWHTQFMFIFTQLEEQNITFLKSLSHSLACSFFLSFVFFFLFLRKNIFFRFKLK